MKNILAALAALLCLVNVASAGSLALLRAGSGGFPLADSTIDLNFATGQSYGCSADFTDCLTSNNPGVYVTDGSGALSFKYGPVTNLTYPSQGGFGTPWSQSNATVVDNNQTAPDGTFTGSTVTDNSTNGGHGVSISNSAVTNGINYIGSVYAAAGTSNLAQISLGGQFGGSAYTNVNLTTCLVVGSGGTGLFFTAEPAANGYCRISVGVTAVATGTASIIVNMINSASAVRNGSYVGTGQTIKVWGGQVNAFSYATQTTPGPYVPTVASSASSIAQLPIASGTGLLAAEEARTNLNTWSNDLTNVAWNFTNQATITSLGLAPDGVSPAYRLQGTGAGWYFGRTFTLTAATYTNSIYVKSNTGSNQTFILFAEGGTILSADLTATTSWQRFQLPFTATATLQGLGIRRNSSNATADLVVAFTQNELGATPSSYIPTTTAAVTRAAYTATATGALATALTGAQASAVTLVGSVSGLGAAGRIIGGNSTKTMAYIQNAAQVGMYNSTTTLIAALGSGSFTAGNVKVASAFDGSGRSVVGNNGTVSTDALTSQAVSTAYLGSDGGSIQFLNGYIKRLSAWNTRLADPVLKALTQ